MIAFLSGIVISKQDRTIILNVSGTGYLIYVTRNLLEKIHPATRGEKLELYIHTNVREDDISLYGFSNKDEWQFFKLLLTVSGVGPKSALEILNMPMPRVKTAIAKKDAVFLSTIPGIGKKTSERIIVDLQGKVKEELFEEQSSVPVREDIVQALISLGYSRAHVVQNLKKIPPSLNSDEEIIKYLLQNV
ncbi:Holliday junction branch migration protein RuvA [Candidatus Peregrinibacteria bacterium]|nr:Holliday junction branch migration protein RuvA [Candidatus Peregrinibacteria bacterium]